MTTLTVPVNLQALRVTDNDATKSFAGATTCFNYMPAPGGTQSDAPNTSDAVVQALMNPAGELEIGVHLHWQLPDAVARGRQNDDGTVEFPRAPDRWLVTRVLKDQRSGNTSAAQWVVESDRLIDDGQVRTAAWSIRQKAPVTAPVGWDHPDSNGAFVPYRRQGVTFRLQDWPPKGAALRVRDLSTSNGKRGLDARGHSGAGFAGYYQDCAGIFGFHDPLEDLLPEGTAPGDLQFTATYHVCGWHSRAEEDPLTGLREAASRLAELRKLGADPSRVAEIRRLEQALSRLSALRKLWTLPEADADLPQRSLYAGSLHRLAWVPKTLYPDEPPPQKALTVTIGSSTSEALAVLLATAPPHNGWLPANKDVPDELRKTPEYLIDALQLGLLHRVHPASALSELEVALHAQGFASSPGGHVWSIGATGAKGQGNAVGTEAEQREVDKVATSILAVELQFSAELEDLNALEQKLDAQERVVASLQRQLYLDWFHYHEEAFGTSSKEQEFEEHVKAMVASLLKSAIAAWGGDANARVFRRDTVERDEKTGQWSTSCAAETTTCGKVAAAAAALEAKLPPGLLLRRHDAPPFWEPQAPVFVMRGDNLRPANRNRPTLDQREAAQRTGDDSSLRLLCRRSEELLRAQGSAPQVWSTLSLPAAADGEEKAGLDPLLADMRVLVDEAGLLDAFRKDRDQPPAGATGIPPAALAETRAPATADGNEGVWADPFLPLYLLWTATVTPLAIALNDQRELDRPQILADAFVIAASSVDFAARGDVPLRSSTVELRGEILLTARAAEPLAAQVRHFLDDTQVKDDGLEQLATDIQSWPLLSQAAGGLNELMLGCTLGLQMAPYNPYAAAAPAEAFDPKDSQYDVYEPYESYFQDDHHYENSITYAVANNVGREISERPAPAGSRDPEACSEAFSPLRSGVLEIIGLHIVDVFGRRLPLLAADPDNGQTSAPTIVPIPSWRLAKLGTAGHAFLPPRFAQAARLLLDWETPVSDTMEDTDTPTASPVCGWIVPDHVDESLMIFDADGTVLCTIGVFGGDDHVSAQPRAGYAQEAAGADAYLAHANQHLCDFVALLVKLSANDFAQLLKAIDDAADYIMPASAAAAQAQSVLMGRPLALVQAALRLELKGLPALNPSRARFAGDDRAPDTDWRKTGEAQFPAVTDWRQRDHGGIVELSVPVHLGDHNMIEDGLVAWVKLGDGKVEGDRIYTPSQQTGPFAVTRENPPLALDVRTSDELTVDKPDKPLGIVVPMLIDPLAAVHVSCGLLPVVRATLRPDMIAAALARIELELFTNPVLRPAAGFAAVKDGYVALPLPPEAGYDWGWVTRAKQGGADAPREEGAKPSALADRALWGYSPLSLEDGWLTLRRTKPAT